MDLDYQAFQLGRDRILSWQASAPPSRSRIRPSPQLRHSLCDAGLESHKIPVKEAGKPRGRAPLRRRIRLRSKLGDTACFLRTYADQWRTNWEAGPVEEGVLTRLSVQDPEKAQAFADKLLSNRRIFHTPNGITGILLMSERRKEEAQQFATEHHIDKAIMASSRYPLPSYMPMKMQIAWPRVARTDMYTYFFGQKTWAPAVIPKQNKPVYISSEWNPPSGSHYSRSWQRSKLASDLCPRWELAGSHGNVSRAQQPR